MKLTELIKDFGRWLLLVSMAIFTILLAGFCLKFFYNVFMLGWRLL
jgi:hypothetical protein